MCSASKATDYRFARSVTSASNCFKSLTEKTAFSVHQNLRLSVYQNVFENVLYGLKSRSLFIECCRCLKHFLRYVQIDLIQTNVVYVTVSNFTTKWSEYDKILFYAEFVPDRCGNMWKKIAQVSLTKNKGILESLRNSSRHMNSVLHYIVFFLLRLKQYR